MKIYLFVKQLYPVSSILNKQTICEYNNSTSYLLGAPCSLATHPDSKPKSREVQKI